MAGSVNRIGLAKEDRQQQVHPKTIFCYYQPEETLEIAAKIRF